MIEASDQDRALGMDFYITDAPGCGGRIRSCPEDFVVEEAWEDQGYEGGRFLVVEVEKKSWDTHHLVREMSRQLRISQKRFGWAGTKDKRALTRQRMSIMNLDEQALERISLPDVKIRVLGKTNRSVGLGDLLGNRFRILIRDLSCPDPAGHLASVTDQIARWGGVPNYFGIQRFGDTRPVTHKVGEALVRGDLERATFTYLSLAYPGELEITRQARRRLWEDRDVRAALKYFPPHLHHELAMLNYLTEHPGDFSHAFDVLSSNLRKLFVHAYQSFLFNRILSQRLAAGLPLERALVGDVFCFVRGDLPDVDRVQAVTAENHGAINRLAARGRAFLTLPLIGYETDLASGVQGEIEARVLSEQGVARSDFRVGANPEFGSRGSRRAALLRVVPGVRTQGNSAMLEFFLPKGCYATVILREYMKNAACIAETEKSFKDLETCN